MFFFRRKHPISDDELSAYVDSQLSADARDRIDVHVEACAACRETLVELRSVRQALHDLPRETAPRSFALRQADVEAPARARPAGAFAAAPSLLGALATVSIIAFVALVAVDAGGTPTGGSGDGVPAGFAPIASEEDEDGSGERLSDDEVQAVEEASPTSDRSLQAGLSGRPTVSGTDGLLESAGPNNGDASTEFSSGDVQREPGEEFAPGSDDGAAAPAPATPAQDDDGGPSRLRVAEAAAAAVALLAGGSFALVWRRRRA